MTVYTTKTLNNFDPAGTLADANNVAVEQGDGISRKTTLGAIKAFFQTAFTALFVQKSGDTMTGRLVIEDVSPFPSVIVRSSVSPAIMDFIGDGQSAGPRIFRHTNNTFPPNFVFYKTRGSAASPSIPNANDFFFSLLGGLWNGSNFVLTSTIEGQLIASSPSSGDLESSLQFQCVPPASATQAQIMRLDHASGLSMYGANTVITPNRLLRTRVFTVATLPVANIATGDTAIVTDANATTLGSVVAGGGSNRVRVNYDGTNWRIG